ncbi:MAG: Gfo/Idh/MocA family oxidoreductase [Micropruina sp.]|uniref:Gfo/Idh/MocA family protein n=1 Tax=Micropruina sp. TaxID=2737536 RepID=UPI0039E50000
MAIVTPNHLHFAPSKAFLEAGIHVICDKPVTTTLAQAKALEAVIAASGKLFMLTHNYTGYPMIRQMREMVAAGAIGKLRHVQAEYAQDWLTEAVEKQGAKGSGMAHRTRPVPARGAPSAISEPGCLQRCGLRDGGSAGPPLCRSDRLRARPRAR